MEMFQLWVRYERGPWQLHDFYGNRMNANRAMETIYNFGSKEFGPAEEHKIVKVEVL